ncbi:MAG: YdcF family protein [Rhodospirillaceae bacterium]|jgi:uncharacterized SAM-binding protein YcdF (DUF218 family)|nr:YdcF family protein [Rhodospirillaceae bacterium]MBT5752432.1 YdcF family protein [Rhodospirillaceae bacterium]
MIPLLKEFLLPPGVFLLAGLIGIWNIQRNPRRAKRILIAVTILFYIFSTKIMASLLVGNLPVPPPLPPQSLDLMDSSDPPQAIVVLGAGLYEAAPEYGGDTVSGGSLARIRYGANLHRRSGLPLLVSGGRPENTKLSEAETMKAALETDFHVPVAWTEDISNTTWEGAQNVHEILAAEGINKIYLVTHANHMIRAEKAFRRAGFDVTPAPTEFWSHPNLRAKDFLPTGGGLAISRHALHEWLGHLWYTIRP